MYEFWYDYVKPRHGKKAKLCYMCYMDKTVLQKILQQDFAFQIMN